MDLKSITDLRNEHVPVPSSCSNDQDDDCIFLPFSYVKDLINNFPLTKKTSVCVQDVHKCLAVMIKRVVEDERMPKESIKRRKSEVTNVEKHISRCELCENQGKFEVDVKQGYIICTSCGCTKRNQIHMESFEKHEEMNTTVSSANTIPKWLMAANSITDKWSAIQIQYDVDHWNAYVNYSEDDLDHVKHIASLMTQRCSDTGRIVAAFIIKYIMKNYNIFKIYEGEFDIPLNHESLRYISKCDACDEKFYTLHSKKRHRCWINAKKPREQWSLVTNKRDRVKISPFFSHF